MKYCGFIDSFANGVLSGWAFASEGSATVDCYLDGALCASVSPDERRPDVAKAHGASAGNSGFRIDLSEPLQKYPLARLQVVFGGTTKPIPFSAGAKRPFFLDLHELVVTNPSPWTPVPPPSIVMHISGVHDPAVQRRSYLASGALGAADVLNVIAALGGAVEQPGYTIVDLGCGNGRVASFFIQHIPDCAYYGFDVFAPAIDWARDNIKSRFPNLDFNLLGQGAKYYSGQRWHELPVAADAADLVLSTSLFTHLNRDAALGYLKEAYRVLRPGGLGYLTFFILDEENKAFVESRAAKNSNKLVKDGPLWSYGTDGYLDSFFAIDEIEKMIAASGLRIRLIRRGHWSGQPHNHLAAYQDLIVVQKL